MVNLNYLNDTMLSGETKTRNLQAKGITDMWKSEKKNMLAALSTPGVTPAKLLMCIEKVNDDKQST
jgi:hypothetical protein